MKTYKQLYSILNLNGEKFLVDIDRWAELTLTGADKAQYDNDRNNDWYPATQQLIESGDITSSFITEVIEVDGIDVEVQIGILFSIRDDSLYRPSFLYWRDRFANDPNVTYNPYVYL